MFGFLIQTYTVSAACCVDYLGGICTDNPPEECVLPSVSFTESCGLIATSQCTDGCCCLESGGGQLVWNLSCTNLGGTFYSFPTTISDCNAFCSGNVLSNYSLSGIVRNGTARVFNASVTLIDRGYANVNSSDEYPIGRYIFPAVQAGQSLNIFAQKGDCSANIVITPFDHDTLQDITLDCCEYECEFGECLNGYKNRTCYAVDPNTCAVDEYTEYNIACSADLCGWDCTDWDPPFSDPNNPNLLEPCPAHTPPYTVRTRTCDPIIVGNCEVGASPDLSIDCSYVGNSCGNGVIEGAEQCDFNQTTFAGDSSCPLPYNTFQYCSPECECVTPTVPEDCNLQNYIYPTEVDAKGVYMKRQVNVTWALPGACADYVSNYTVYGCRNTTSCNFINVSGPLPDNVNKFIVPNSTQLEFFEHARYCFKVRTNFNESLNFLSFDSNPDCMQMGDNFCLSDHDDSWCGVWQGKQAVLYCSGKDVSDPGNIITLQGTPCNSGEYCGVVSGIPQCLPISECERCNGLFGIFGYQGLEIEIFGGGTLKCPTVSSTLTSRVATKTGGGSTGCFLDYSNTSVDKTYNCSIVSSCYDYKSRSSCTSDYCDKFDVNVYDKICEWKDYSTVFNKGVCRPKKQYVDLGAAIQDCSLCNNPLYNRIYGQCTEDTCELYGECYFKTDTSGNGQCIDARSLSCSDYTTQEDCIGVDELGNGLNVSVNTRWNVDGTKKTAGTNRVLNESRDKLNIGRCEWDGTKCFRNADNLSDTFGEIGIDCRMTDLSGDYNKSLCERDFNTPTTTITSLPYYGEIMDLRDSMTISDYWDVGDNYSDPVSGNNRKHVWLYYGIDDNYKYPGKIMRITSPNEEQNYRINILDEIPDRLEETGQLLYFFYFAEDPARNLEVVKNFSFILDITEPTITRNWRIDSYEGEFDWGDWAANYYVNITLSSEISMPVKCYYNITPIIEQNRWTMQHEASNLPSYIPPLNNIITTVPGSLATTYFELWPDRYYYELKCSDKVGNFHYENGTFTLDGDLSINSPFPKDETYTTASLPPRISINTTADGTCKYSMTTPIYDNMEHTYEKINLSNGNYTFYSPKEVVFQQLDLGVPVPSRVYKIYSACDLIINGQHVKKPAAIPDMIRFAVDDLRPVTRLRYQPDITSQLTENFTNNQTLETLYLYLDNDDYSPVLVDGAFNMYFDSYETFYCVNTTFGICNYMPFDLDPTTQNPIMFNYIETGPGSDIDIYGTYPQFCYYSIDNGMNQEQEKCILLNLTNKLFLEPNISIIPQ